MIGLQSNAFAIIGYESEELTLTRIDCSNLIHEALCLYPDSGPELPIWKVICYGEDTLRTNGIYQSTLSDSNGCDSTVRVEIFVIPNSNPQINPEFVANGGNGYINLNSNCANCTFLWGNGSTDGYLDSLQYGNYSVTITSHPNCTYTYDFNLEMSTSVFNKNMNEKFKLFPSICNAGEEIKIEGEIKDAFQLNIYNLNGSKIKSFQSQNSNLIRFNAPKNQGLFLIQIITKENVIINRKLIVK